MGTSIGHLTVIICPKKLQSDVTGTHKVTNPEVKLFLIQGIMGALLLGIEVYYCAHFLNNTSIYVSEVMVINTDLLVLDIFYIV